MSSPSPVPDFDSKPEAVEPQVFGQQVLRPDSETQDGLEENAPAEGKRQQKGDSLW